MSHSEGVQSGVNERCWRCSVGREEVREQWSAGKLLPQCCRMLFVVVACHNGATRWVHTVEVSTLSSHQTGGAAVRVSNLISVTTAKMELQDL